MAASNGLDLAPKCAAGVDTKRRVIQLESASEDQWKAINSLRNRLPAWATVVISLLSMGLGVTLTYASLAQRLAQAGIMATTK